MSIGFLSEMTQLLTRNGNFDILSRINSILYRVYNFIPDRKGGLRT
jgi:hypothetical protein